MVMNDGLWTMDSWMHMGLARVHCLVLEPYLQRVAIFRFDTSRRWLHFGDAQYLDTPQFLFGAEAQRTLAP